VTAASLHDEPQVEQVSYIFGQLRSDYANFVASSVPTVFFSDSTGGCYHTTGDDVALVDWVKVGAQSRIAFRVAVALAENASAPGFVGPNPMLATYDDAVAVAQVTHLGRRDRFLLSTTDQAGVDRINQDVSSIVAAGRSAFDAMDVAVLLA